MIVPEGEPPIILNGVSSINSTEGEGPLNIISTGTLTPSDVENKIQHPPFSMGYKPKATSISFTGTTACAQHPSPLDCINGTLSVTFYNPGADSYELSFATKIETDVGISKG